MALALAFAASTTMMHDVYICEHVGAMSNGAHTPLREDMRLERRSLTGGNEAWAVTMPGDEAIAAEAFPVESLNVGGSLSLSWMDKRGKRRKAFLLFSDEIAHNGSKSLWLNLGTPSMWQPPGYFCMTGPVGSGKGAQ